MKRVEAVIRAEKIDDVKSALAQAGYVGMTTYEVRGRGRQKGYSRFYRGREFRYDLLPKLKIELVVDDKDIEGVIEVIESKAATGDVGDGKIFVFPVDEIIRIRTGERGQAAI